MLDVAYLEEFAKKQKFSPISIKTNVLLLVILMLGFGLFRNAVKKYFSGFTQAGNVIKKTRRYLLSFWFFILPFWSQLSHFLLALSLALLIVESLNKKDKSILNSLKLFTPLILLFLIILLIDFIYHPLDFENDFGDYIYFLLTPFVFLGIKKEGLKKQFEAFKLNKTPCDTPNIAFVCCIPPTSNKHLLLEVQHYPLNAPRLFHSLPHMNTAP